MPINGFLYPGISGPPSPYDVANSVRLDGSSAYMTRTMGTPTNTDKYTFSFWVKRSKLGTQQSIFRSTNGNNDSHVTFQADDTLRFEEYGGLSTIGKLQTSQVFRDVSAWYHIVLVYNSGNSTAGNRMRMYVNGTEVTAFGTDTNPSQNADSFFNKSGEPLHFGRTDYSGGGNYFGGYLAEVVMCDGQALDPTSFGEFDSDSPTIWKPISVSGLNFGNNGFYLDFEDSGDLGDDESGNGNDFTETNLAATDQSTDTCTNNFATFNSLNLTASNTSFEEGNLTFKTDSSASGQKATFANFGISTGKWYAEFKMTAESTQSGSFPYIGVAAIDKFSHTYIGANLDSVAFNSNQAVYSNESEIDSGETNYGDGDIVGVAADITNKKIYFHVNGTYINSQNPASGTNGYTLPSTTNNFYCFAASLYGASGTWEANFGSPAFSISSGNADGEGFGNFEYAVPSGFFSLCSSNLAEYG